MGPVAASPAMESARDNAFKLSRTSSCLPLPKCLEKFYDSKNCRKDPDPQERDPLRTHPARSTEIGAEENITIDEK